MIRYPKIISHHGFELEKLDVGVYKYRSYLIVSDVVYGGFCLRDDCPKGMISSTGSLCLLCRYIDMALSKPVAPTLPIEIVSINYKSI